MTKQEFDNLYKEKVCEALNKPISASIGVSSLLGNNPNPPKASDFLGILLAHCLAVENSQNGEVILIENSSITQMSNGELDIEVRFKFYDNSAL